LCTCDSRVLILISMVADSEPLAPLAPSSAILHTQETHGSFSCGVIQKKTQTVQNEC
jgi:hypothetical protein